MRSPSLSRSSSPVLIVGAGPTGLVLALWLTKLGVTVRIIDKTADAAPFSRALGVQARTLEFYRQLGFAEALVQNGVSVQGVNLWVRGVRVAQVAFADAAGALTPFPFVLDFAQDAHERLLMEQLDSHGVKVERCTELIGFDQHSDGINAKLALPDGSTEVCNAVYIAGCDGARSRLRELLGIDFPGGTYSELFYVADVEADGPAADGQVHIDLDRTDLLAVFAMKGNDHVRLVGTVREETVKQGRELTFADVSDRVIHHMGLKIGKVSWFSTYRVHHRVAARFGCGCAFLLGDAAHIHSPVGAQGMNTGIGDSVNLAWKIAAVLNDGAPQGLLDSYELERIRFARRLVATTDRVFTLATKQGTLAATIRTRLVPTIGPFLLRFPFIRRFLFKTVSQIGIHYRDSPITVNSAGAIRGGDRLPWIRTLVDGSNHADNFAPLSSVAWQAHLYGDPQIAVIDACNKLSLPLHVFAWTPEMSKAGLTRDTTYLIRPDGYIALVGVGGDPNPLLQYFDQHLTTAGPRRRTE